MGARPMAMSRTVLSWLLCLLIATAPAAEEITIPNSFTNGHIAVAADVNANFDAVETGVDDNAADIDVLEAWKAAAATVEVPRDYSTVQAALDSSACKHGTATADQGCHLVASQGTYSEKFEIGSTSGDTGNYQNSILFEGTGPAGLENSIGVQQCGSTFVGNNTTNATIVRVNNTIGGILRNFCIDMNETANKPKYGIEIGYDVGTTKHITVEHVTIEDGTVSGGAGIKIGNGASADAPFITLNENRIDNVPTCLVIDSNQAVDIDLNGIECTGPTGAIGGLSVTAVGGEVTIDHFYMRSGADGQTGINIHNLATGILSITTPTFEWPNDGGTMLKFDDDVSNPSTARYRAVSILGGRLQPQKVPTTPLSCLTWSRNGTLNVIGTTIESGLAESGAPDSRQCTLDFDNPHASRTTVVNLIGMDVDFNGTRAIVVHRTTAGGPLIVNVQGTEGPVVCTGTGDGITLASTGCHKLLDSTDIDTSTELGNIIGDETGSGAFVRATSPALTTPAIGAATATTASTGDNDTSVATTAFVKGEIDARGLANSGQTDNRLVRTDGTTGDIQSTGITVDDSDNATVPGKGQFGGSAVGCIIVRDTDNAGDTEVRYLNGTASTNIDTDGLCNGS